MRVLTKRYNKVQYKITSNHKQAIVDSTSYQQNPVNLLKITEKCLKSSINNRYNTNLSVRVRIPVRVLGVSGCPVSDLTSAENFRSNSIHLTQTALPY